MPKSELNSVKTAKFGNHRQVDWFVRLLHHAEEIATFDSRDRLISARDFLHCAIDQLVKLGEEDGDDCLLLAARVCQKLEDAVSDRLKPVNKEVFERAGLKPPTEPTPQEIRRLQSALRTAASTIDKATKSGKYGVGIPTANERSKAAVVCRDNIAHSPQLSAEGYAKDSKYITELLANDLLMACHVGFGGRFLLNKGKLPMSERFSSWSAIVRRILDRADISEREGKLQAATRIVMSCARAEGMTPGAAKELFKRDARKPKLRGHHQVKMGQTGKRAP